MALIFNNLLINRTSKKYPPFLINLVSGRRRALREHEFALVLSMLNKTYPSEFNSEELILYDKLVNVKQFMDDNTRKTVESSMSLNGFFKESNKPSKPYLSIQLTQDCNMRCVYCFERSYLNRHLSMSMDKIDAICDFYRFCDDVFGFVEKPSIIRITGGEPLVSRANVELINYIAQIWNDSEIALFTNGCNLKNYYDILPMSKIQRVDVSLDGLPETHLLYSKPDARVQEMVYWDIIDGIKRLIHDDKEVNIKSILHKNNYMDYPDFVQYLRSENILGQPNVRLQAGVVTNYASSLDIDNNFNDVNECLQIQNYMMEKCQLEVTSFMSLTVLWGIMARTNNEPALPKTKRCDTSFLSNIYFSPDGNFYFCDCMDDNKGIIGTYFPKISIDNEAIEKLENRCIMKVDKCKECPYKFVCLGGCPLSSYLKGEDVSCGVFAEPNILNNLEFPCSHLQVQD